MNDAQAIHELGGPTKLAARLKLKGVRVSAGAVIMWKINGIPWRFRPPVAEIADDEGLALPNNFLRVRLLPKQRRKKAA